MSERLPCQTPGCQATILPATALKTGGVCMPCHQKKLAQEKKAYIEQNRKDVDLYAGVDDPVEVLVMMHRPRTYNPLENVIPYPKTAQELYHQLSATECERLETYAITLLDEDDDDQAETILLSLICFADARIDRGQEALLRKEKYYPGIIFKEAGYVIRDQLILRVGVDSVNRNHLLLALAWIGDDEVVRLFAEWRQHPPEWAGELYIPPEAYAKEAGWELDSRGRKRLLFYPESYHFQVCREEHPGEHPAPSAVAAMQSGDCSCSWCGGRLTVLFDYDLQDPLVQFMQLPGRRLRIAACLHCNCYGTVFMKVDAEGGYTWSEHNIVPEYLPVNEEDVEELSWHSMQLSVQPAGSYESAYWTLEAPASQIGGHPAWIQDAEYPVCPSCSETMKFVGQMDMEQVEDGEGIYYAFLCKTCLITAVNYQQT